MSGDMHHVPTGLEVSSEERTRRRALRQEFYDALMNPEFPAPEQSREMVAKLRSTHALQSHVFEKNISLLARWIGEDYPELMVGDEKINKANLKKYLAGNGIHERDLVNRISERNIADELIGALERLGVTHREEGKQAASYLSKLVSENFTHDINNVEKKNTIAAKFQELVANWEEAKPEIAKAVAEAKAAGTDIAVHPSVMQTLDDIVAIQKAYPAHAQGGGCPAALEAFEAYIGSIDALRRSVGGFTVSLDASLTHLKDAGVENTDAIKQGSMQRFSDKLATMRGKVEGKSAAPIGSIAEKERSIRRLAGVMETASPEVAALAMKAFIANPRARPEVIARVFNSFQAEVSRATVVDMLSYIDKDNSVLRDQMAKAFGFESAHYDPKNAAHKAARVNNAGYWEMLGGNSLRTRAFGRIQADGLWETIKHRVGGDNKHWYKQGAAGAVTGDVGRLGCMHVNLNRGSVALGAVLGGHALFSSTHKTEDVATGETVETPRSVVSRGVEMGVAAACMLAPVMGRRVL